jgi:hypothetical protein
MNNFRRVVFALALLSAASSTTSFASSLYFVQGLAGRNYAAATDPAFPVDILLNDEVCYVHGLSFGNILGPVTFEPGTYNIKVSIANSLAPCTNSPLIDRSVTVEAQSDMSAVIALDQNSTPVLETFTNNLSPVAANSSRLLLAQSANSPAVEVILENSETKKFYTYSVNPASLLDVSLPAGDYSIEVNQGTTTLVYSTTLHLNSQSVTLAYVIGQASNSTVVLETRLLPDVI